MINIQYFKTAQDIKDAYGDNVPSNVVCVAGNNDSVLINTSNNNPHVDKEEQDKPTIVNKINNLDITISPAKWDITLKPDNKHTGLGTVTVNAVTSSIDSNIQPENIKQGVSILGVEGTLREGSDVFVVPNGLKFGYSLFEEVPSNLDFSNVQDMSDMFSNCPRLTTIQSLDLSNATDLSGMFSFCSSLTTVQLLNTLNVTKLGSMFSGCSRLTTVQSLDTSNATDLHWMFTDCDNLTTIPQLNTNNVTNMDRLFSHCRSLTSIPQLITSNVTNMDHLFNSCRSLTSIPSMDTSNVTNMDWMLYNCNSLTTVEGIDFSGLSNINNLFGEQSEPMPNITRFIVNGKINISVTGGGGFEALTNIDYDSVKSILAAADRTDNTNEKTLAFNRTMTDQNGELAALVTSCTSKGWIITGLTIE